MKKFSVTVFIEIGKDKTVEEVQVEAEGPSPEATTAAYRIMAEKYKNTGYRMTFGEIRELEDNV